MTTAQMNNMTTGLLDFVFLRWMTGSALPYALGASFAINGTTGNGTVTGQWRWLDGTDASNLNCDGTACHLWDR